MGSMGKFILSCPEGWPEEVAQAVFEERKKFLETETPEDEESFDNKAAIQKAKRMEVIAAICGLLSVTIRPVNDTIAEFLEDKSVEELARLAIGIHRAMGRAIVEDTFADIPADVDREDIIEDIMKALSLPEPLREPAGVPDRLRVVVMAIEQEYMTLEEVKALIRKDAPTEMSDVDRNPALLKLREKFAAYDGPTISLHDIFGIEDDGTVN